MAAEDCRKPFYTGRLWFLPPHGLSDDALEAFYQALTDGQPRTWGAYPFPPIFVYMHGSKIIEYYKATREVTTCAHCGQCALCTKIPYRGPTSTRTHNGYMAICGKECLWNKAIPPPGSPATVFILFTWTKRAILLQQFEHWNTGGVWSLAIQNIRSRSNLRLEKKSNLLDFFYY